MSHDSHRSTAFIPLILILLACGALHGQEHRFTIPYVTGRPEMQPFAGHPGWVEVFTEGSSAGIGARIDDRAVFRLPDGAGDRRAWLIATFDRLETPPVIIPDFDPARGGDWPIPVEYACVPAGYPDVWTDTYMQRGRDFFQIITPRATQLYGVTFFDGPKFAEWGNKINVSVHKDAPDGELIMVEEAGEGVSEHVSATHSDFGFPRIGWRHGDMPVEPGRPHAVRVGAYRHGGAHFRLDAFIRPDRGDGYPYGSAAIDGVAVDGDLCALIFGNAHGQLVETHIRSEEWELFIPSHRPTRSWGQSFRAHGRSLAGITFYAGTDGDDEPITCEIRIRPDGEWERPIGPTRLATGRDSPVRPIIRYPESPRPLEDHATFYRLPSKLFQVAYLPDEVPLTPGRTYYVEITASRPIMAYADGDYYKHGHAYYEGLKVDRLGDSGRRTFHSLRWTLAMSIVTYAGEGDEP